MLYHVSQEAAVIPPYVAFAIRPNPGFWEFVKVNANDLSVDGITATDYLKFKETIVDENWYINLVFMHFMDLVSSLFLPHRHSLSELG